MFADKENLLAVGKASKLFKSKLKHASGFDLHE